MLKTPLYDTHVKMGARMVDFAGWSMPIAFAGITAEHVHTRTACSAFDVSHMGRLRMTGSDCEQFLDTICTRKLAGAEAGRCYYSHVCREDGGILDDVIVSRGEDYWYMVCNASNRDKIVGWLTRHMEGFDVSLADETLATAMLAIQGPQTLDIAQGRFNFDASQIKRYRFIEKEVMGIRLMIFRSGYTGEDGLELVMPAGVVSMFLPYLFGADLKADGPIKPAGLGARDTLRIEAAMPLYGHELTEDWDSLAAGQAWCVDLNKDFIGADSMRSLQKHGLPRKLVGLELEGRRIARQHQGIHFEGEEVGEITSGTLSPTLGKSIAMGFVPTVHATPGTEFTVDLGKTQVPCTVVELPFYSRKK